MSNILTNNINPRSGNLITIGGTNDRVSIAGTLSYEDVSNIDSVGIITARDGLDTPTNLVLRTGGTERVRIDSSGNFGIKNNTGLLIENTDGTQRRVIHIDTDNNLYLNSNAQNNSIIFQSGGGNERARITSGGNFGIGTTSPISELHIEKATQAHISVMTASSNMLKLGSKGNDVYIAGTAGATNVIFKRNVTSTDHPADSGTETVRIDSLGNLLLGKTSAVAAGDGYFVQPDGTFAYTTSQTGTGPLGYFYNEGSTANGFRYVSFRLGAFTQVGTIATNGTSSVSYNTTSDYRLKENVVDISNGINRVKQLQPKRFNFIVDPGTTVDGFLAHEAQAVVPQSVTGTKDEVDDDGNPVMQGIDQSKLVPLLTAALQEAIAKIETLEQRLTDAGL